MPATQKAIEIGVGTGRFAAPLGISVGVEPSVNMAKIAEKRGIAVTQAYGEALPFPRENLDLALLVTVLCFVDDILTVLCEVARILKPGGYILIGLIDPHSPLGQSYEQHKASSTFYQGAHFNRIEVITNALKKAGFDHFEYRQTIMQAEVDHSLSLTIEPGYGKGAFVVIRAERQPL